MAFGFVASAFVPAFCEEAIRSSYLYYLADKGRRRAAVLAIAAVFVIGEAIYDVSLFSAARAEIGAGLAAALLLAALVLGAGLHLALTLATAHRQQAGRNVWATFGGALAFHTCFNLIAIAVIYYFVDRPTTALSISFSGF
ncbi:MAG: hypothetical protein AAFY56_11075 [Pseudomonadota bacterium]